MRPGAAGRARATTSWPTSCARGELDEVQAPTLCIVGGKDTQVLELNRQALEKLKTEKQLDVIPDAGHLFEEPGALEEVAHRAREWFQQHLEA